MLRRGQTILDAQIRPQPIELVLAGGSAFAQTEQAVGKLLAIFRKYGADADRTAAATYEAEMRRSEPLQPQSGAMWEFG